LFKAKNKIRNLIKNKVQFNWISYLYKKISEDGWNS
jgi:hypothetical protein